VVDGHRLIVIVIHLCGPPVADAFEQACQAAVAGRVAVEQKTRPVAAGLDLAADTRPAFGASATAAANRVERAGPNTTVTSRSTQAA
jgi:hypothetical protein